MRTHKNIPMADGTNVRYVLIQNELNSQTHIMDRRPASENLFFNSPVSLLIARVYS